MWPDVRALYRMLIALFPRAFRERLGESMAQTFNDLYQERQMQKGLFSLVLWIFVETGVGVIHEHALQITQGDIMKNILSNPKSAAILSFILSLPLALPYIIFMFDIEPLTGLASRLLATDDQQINNLGRIVLFGGLLLLPPAFVINLAPFLKRKSPDQKNRFYAFNLILGMGLLLLITFTWGGLLLEEIQCLRGMYCD
jgi:hypothetical protein